MTVQCTRSRGPYRPQAPSALTQCLLSCRLQSIPVFPQCHTVTNVAVHLIVHPLLVAGTYAPFHSLPSSR